MMRKHFTLLSAVLALIVTLMLPSCGGDDDEPQQDTSIRLSTYDITFQNGGGSRTVNLESAGHIQSAHSSATWLSVAHKGGSSITLTALPNYYSDYRTCKVEVTNQSGRTATIDITQLGTSGTGGNDNSGSGNDNSGSGNDNSGGGNDNSGSGGSDDSNSESKPDAPTNLRVTEIGSAALPNCVLRWNESSGATRYTIYRSLRENSGYSQIGTSQYASYADQTIKVGNTYYYRVTASNSYGTSDYSNTATCEFSDRRKPGPPVYGNCTATSTQITLRWSTPSDASYGKPTKHILRVYNPYRADWDDVQTLSGTATSASFSYSKYVDDDGYVKCGIIAENDYGSATQGAKVYDTKSKRWLN